MFTDTTVLDLIGTEFSTDNTILGAEMSPLRLYIDHDHICAPVCDHCQTCSITLDHKFYDPYD